MKKEIYGSNAIRVSSTVLDDVVHTLMFASIHTCVEVRKAPHLPFCQPQEQWAEGVIEPAPQGPFLPLVVGD